MVGALRVVSVERGHDPRDFTLAPFGGAGPLHGCALAALLGITRVLIPPAPGVLCADGLLAADLKAEFSRTLPKAGAGRRSRPCEPIFAELERQADDWLSAEGVAAEDRGKRRVALMRYHGQGGEIAVAWGRTRAAVEAAFVAAHQALYGFNLEFSDRAGDGPGRGDRPHARAAAAGAGPGRRDRSSSARCISPAGSPTCRSMTGRCSARANVRRAGDHHAARCDHVR